VVLFWAESVVIGKTLTDLVLHRRSNRA